MHLPTQDMGESNHVAEQAVIKEKAAKIITGLKDYIRLDAKDPKGDNFSWTYEIQDLGICYQKGGSGIKNLIVTGVTDIILEHRNSEDFGRGDIRELLGVFKVKELSESDMGWKDHNDKLDLQRTL